MYLKSLILFLGIALFSACGAAASSVSKEWIMNPPADSAHYFYGVGSGDSVDAAKNDALANISAKISVDVASTFSSSVSATRLGDDEQVLSNTKNEVVAKSKQINYTDVKVVESLQEGRNWSVLVEVDRSILRKNYEVNLEKVDTKLKTEWELYSNASIFEKLKISVAINSLLKETDSIFPLLHALDKNYDDSAYTARYAEYTKAMRKARGELVFKIVSDKNSQTLASLVRSELSAINAAFNDSKYNVLISIETVAKEKRVKSANDQFNNLVIALRKTTIKATDASGNIVSNTEYKTKESSVDGFEDAIARTAKYEGMIQERGIVAFITGN
ncbi:MAG: LPP20 family lipoprotein [Epsilonproteobacteria bacterium]|nr:LPP20 family lipoprotein [Campylobacterota bacterium]